MEPNYSQIFNKETLNSLVKFCELNNIENIDVFLKKCFDLGFNIEKYGLLGEEGEIKEKIVEVPVEVIKEIIVEKEVPVEKIVEKIVEVEIEVPVEKIIEKEVFITDNEQVKKLTRKILELEKDLTNEKQKNLTIINKTEDKNQDLLKETLQKLRKENFDKTKKIEELEKINQELENNKIGKKGFLMKGSNLNDTLWHNY